MSTKATRPLPVDNFDPEDLDPVDWSRNDGPGRYCERLSEHPSRFEAALAEIREHQATLVQVRKARSLTQTNVATLLEMDQSEVSRLERRSDMLLSTLRSFIQAAGGELELIVTFPESEPVQLLVGPTRPQEKATPPMASNTRKEQTSKKAASSANKILGSPKAAKSATGSALAQSGNRKVTGKKAAEAASKTLRSKTASKSAKSVAASTLTQRSGQKRK